MGSVPQNFPLVVGVFLSASLFSGDRSLEAAQSRWLYRGLVSIVPCALGCDRITAGAFCRVCSRALEIDSIFCAVTTGQG